MWLHKLDDTDPIDRSYRRYIHLFAICAQVVVVLAILAWVVGIPHLQCWEYTYAGTKPRNGIVSAEQKLDAWYLGITGWKHVRSGEFGHYGCPYILFIPIEQCVDLSDVKSIFPFSLFTGGKFDG